MGQILHGAREAVRRAIRHSQESLRVLAKRHGIDQKTVAKWKRRRAVKELPTGPRDVHSTVLSIENVDRSYAANGLNQYSSAGPATFGYDADGNLTSDGSSSYTYDVENRLVAASGAASASLSYDPLGRLWQVTGSSGTTQFLYDGAALAAEYDGTGALKRQYGYRPGDDVPVYQLEYGLPSPSLFLHRDRLGSVVAVSSTSASTAVVDSYDEYGIPGSANSGRFQYTGQAWLPEVGMYYYKARMYSPSLGRFMQTDPIGYADGLNWYNYVGGDPVNFVDPWGLETTTTPCGVSGAPACPDIIVTGIRPPPPPPPPPPPAGMITAPSAPSQPRDGGVTDGSATQPQRDDNHGCAAGTSYKAMGADGKPICWSTPTTPPPAPPPSPEQQKKDHHEFCATMGTIGGVGGVGTVAKNIAARGGLQFVPFVDIGVDIVTGVGVGGFLLGGCNNGY